MLCRIGVGQYYIGIPLQSIEIMPGEAFAFFSGDQQASALLDECPHIFLRNWFTSLQSFIHGDDELGQRAEPGKPGIVGEQLQEILGGRDTANRSFVAHPFGVNQGFVQGQQRFAEILQLLKNSVCHSGSNFAGLPLSVNDDRAPRQTTPICQDHRVAQKKVARKSDQGSGTTPASITLGPPTGSSAELALWVITNAGELLVISAMEEFTKLSRPRASPPIQKAWQCGVPKP